MSIKGPADNSGGIEAGPFFAVLSHSSKKMFNFVLSKLKTD